MTLLAGALIGAFSGGAGGFALAVVVLASKRRRNARRVDRGEPPLRDAVLVPFHLPGAAAGAVAGALGALLGDLGWALAGGIVLPGLFLAVALLTFGRLPR